MEKSVADREMCNSFLQWGIRKRTRCSIARKSEENCGGLLSNSTIRVDRRVVRAEKEMSHEEVLQAKSVIATIGKIRSCSSSERNEKVWRLPEKVGVKNSNLHNGGVVLVNKKNNNNSSSNSKSGADAEENKGDAAEWPKFTMSLTRSEKEQDFLAIKGTKLPTRPKKRTKLVHRTVLSVCPGGWLSELSHDRYEVKEKKSIKKSSLWWLINSELRGCVHPPSWEVVPASMWHYRCFLAPL